MPSLMLNFIATLWTPIFVAIFAGIVAYALWPDNRDSFDAAAKMPLRED